MGQNRFDGSGNLIPGRGTGSPHKIKTTARAIFLATLEEQVPHIKVAFEKLRDKDPEKYLEVFAKYAHYFVPKMVELSLEDKTINVKVPGEIEQGFDEAEIIEDK